MKKMMFDLSGKKAVVTGGGSGIGEAIATALAEGGAEVIILDLNKDAAQLIVDKITNAGGVSSALACDVRDPEHVASHIDNVGPIDILVNNAGIAHVGNVGGTSVEDFDKILNVNVRGVFNCLKSGVKNMPSSGGVIINVSSIAAHVGVSDRFAYSMSKGAVHAMTLSIAKDYISKGIRCNSISPARVHTPFVDGFLSENYPGNETEMFQSLSKTQPIGRMGKPEEIGAMVLYLCSDEAAFITGTDFPIDGGFITLNN